jgi:hypothetical protein
MGTSILGYLTALGIGGVFAALVAGIFNRRRVSGDYVTAIAGAATTLVRPLQDEVARLMAALTAQQDRHTLEVAALRDELAQTQAELRESYGDCERRTSQLTERLEDAREAVRLLRQKLDGRNVTDPPGRGTLEP